MSAPISGCTWARVQLCPHGYCFPDLLLALELSPIGCGKARLLPKWTCSVRHSAAAEWVSTEFLSCWSLWQIWTTASRLGERACWCSRAIHWTLCPSCSKSAFQLAVSCLSAARTAEQHRRLSASSAAPHAGCLSRLPVSLEPERHFLYCCFWAAQEAALLLRKCRHLQQASEQRK